MTDEVPRRRSSHLMDPDVLRERYEARMRAEHEAHAAGRPLSTAGETVYVTDRAERRGGMHIERVREFVLSALVVVTLFHFTIGMAVVALLAHDPVARIGLSVLALLSGLGAVVSARLIHHRSLLTPWLLVGASVGIATLVMVLT